MISEATTKGEGGDTGDVDRDLLNNYALFSFLWLSVNLFVGVFDIEIVQHRYILASSNLVTHI